MRRSSSSTAAARPPGSPASWSARRRAVRLRSSAPTSARSSARRSAPRCRASPRAPSATRSAPCSRRALATPAPAPPAGAAAASPKKAAPALRPSSSSVYVGGLHGSQLDGGPRAAQEMLTAELGKWGGVAKVTLKLFAKNTTGYGFVNFLSQKDAEAAVGAYVAGDYVSTSTTRRSCSTLKCPAAASPRRKRRRTRKRRRRRRRIPRAACARRGSSGTWVGARIAVDDAKEALAAELGKWGDVADVTLKPAHGLRLRRLRREDG